MVLSFGLLFCGRFAWRRKITLQLRFVFVCSFHVILFYSNSILFHNSTNLFNWFWFFENVRITLNYGNSWNVWITYGSYVIKWSYFSYIIFMLTNFLIKLIFLIMLRLRFLWYVYIKYGDNVTITFRICSAYLFKFFKMS